jgi:formyltetrahydrofolate-dependent phosphoribosylglycinamide formyltransferase
MAARDYRSTMADAPTTPPPLRLAVLLSGGGTTLQNLAEVIARGELDAEIACVVSSRPDAFGVQRAANLGLPRHVVVRKSCPSVAAFSERVFRHVREARANLVCLAGFLSLLDIPDDFVGRVLNIHPALLPSFGGKGMHGHHVHEAVLAAGCKVSGCTVHLADQTYDTGPILVQRCCPVRDDDTPDTLAGRVFEQECLAYPEAIRMFLAGIVIEGRLARAATPGVGTGKSREEKGKP